MGPGRKLGHVPHLDQHGHTDLHVILHVTMEEPHAWCVRYMYIVVSFIYIDGERVRERRGESGGRESGERVGERGTERERER